MDAAADDNVAQTIQASLAPLKTAFPPLLTSKRYRRLDVSRLVMDFYTHRACYRAAWTNDSDVAQLIKKFEQLQADGLNPADFHVDEIVRTQPSVQTLTAASTEQRAAFDIATTHTFITALLQLRRGKVDPSRLDNHWNFDSNGVDPRNDINAFFAALDNHDGECCLRHRHKRRCTSVCVRRWRNCAVFGIGVAGRKWWWTIRSNPAWTSLLSHSCASIGRGRFSRPTIDPRYEVRRRRHRGGEEVSDRTVPWRGWYGGGDHPGGIECAVVEARIDQVR